jgi:hypothetical protein
MENNLRDRGMYPLCLTNTPSDILFAKKSQLEPDRQQPSKANVLLTYLVLARQRGNYLE